MTSRERLLLRGAGSRLILFVGRLGVYCDAAAEKIFLDESSVGGISGFVKAVTDWPARYFVALAFVAGALLFASHSRWADAFGLSAGPAWFRLVLTVATLAFFAIGLVKGLTHVEARRASKAAARARGMAFERELRSLTAEESAVFAAFLNRESKTATFAFVNGGPSIALTARALAVRGHLYEISRRDTMWFTEIAYAIQEPVFAFLQQHPELLANARTDEGENEPRVTPPPN